MAVTVNDKVYTVWGNKAVMLSNLAFDSSYPFGGESFNTDLLLGLHEIDTVLFEHKAGFSFEYDYSNDKIKVFRDAPPLVFEEYHELDSSYQFTLDYPPAFITNIAQPGQNIKLRSPGISYATLGDGEASATAQFAAGTRSTFIVDPVDLLGGDGAFTGGSTNWTLASGWEYGTNAVAHSSNGTGTLAHDTFAAVVGKKYRLTYTISSWSVGTVTPTLGGTAGTAVGADGTYTEDFTATTTDGIVFTPTNAARFTIDSITIESLDVYTTYVTQAWKDVWDNLVQDETKTLATGANTLSSGNKIIACMYVDQTTATAAALAMVDEDDTVASGEIDLAFGATTAQLTAHSAQNAKAVKVTYIKDPGSGFLHDRFFKNEGATKAGSDPYTNTFDYPILLWGYTGQMPVNGQATERIIDYAGTPEAGECVVDWFNPGTRGAAAPASGTVVGLKDDQTGTASGVWGVISEIQTVPLEVRDGENLSALSAVRAVFIGQ